MLSVVLHIVGWWSSWSLIVAPCVFLLALLNRILHELKLLQLAETKIPINDQRVAHVFDQLKLSDHCDIRTVLHRSTKEPIV